MAGTVTMATTDVTLSELLETDFLKCTLCKTVYQNPRVLPCLHTFCLKCIDKVIENENQSNKTETQSVISNQSEDSLQNDEGELTNGNGDTQSNWNETVYGKDLSFACPICKSMITLGKLDKKGFPENTFIQDLCTMLGYKHDKTRNCEYCKFDGKVVSATHLCLDCHDNMCQSCTGAHHRTKLTRCHKVIPYAQVKKGLYDIDIREYQSQLCNIHADEPLNMFCEKCEVLICKECKVEIHDDHKWLNVDKAMTKYETQMKNLLGGIQQQIPSIHKYIQFVANYDASVERNREKAIEKVNQHAALLHKLIDEQKASALEVLNQETDKERCQIQVRSSNLKTAVTSLENNETYLRLLLRYGKADEILSLHRQINQRLTQLTHMQMDGITNRLKADFTNGSASAKNLQIVFGKMTVSHESFAHSDSGLASQNALQISNVLPNVENSPDLQLQFEGSGMTDSKEVWPTGITVTPNNEFAIVDRDNKIVKIFDKKGMLKQEISGKGDNKIAIPFDIATLKSGDLVITDHEAEDVKVFTVKGEHVLTIKEGIKYPRGVTVNSKGQIIIIDCQHRHVTIHDPTTGNLIRTIEGKDNKGSKVLVDPYYVAVTPQDNIMITDTAAPHIKFFSPTGEYLANYGHYGNMKKDEILQPFGICSDGYGYIFVADNQNHRIHVLMPDVKFSKFLVTKADSLWHPMGLSITPTGDIAVTEALGKVKVYKYL